MKIKIRKLLFFLISFLLISLASLGVDTEDTRLLTQPAVSADHIAFVYANDLWIANLDGTFPRRLTVDEGVESDPVFSPDGKHIAFSAQYDGNTDVFIVPIEGGVPQRLTWHPGNDIVRGFTPDGSAVLFVSQREVHTNRYMQFFTVPVNGGFPARLVIPNGWRASYSPDGKYMAYTPIPGRYAQWKNYRGGTVATIWLFSFEDHSVEKIPQPEGRCNDTDPMWIGNKVYFRSDRNGEFNLFSYNTGTKDIEQVTDFTDFPIIEAAHGSGQIIFEQAGYLHLLNLETESSDKLTIGIATDLLELRPRYVSGND
ncbi:MAG: PD40 domain-containing protein, partial [Bacteroidales bacterium]|nr:PD40 domain-containing protein [Bacteroidales bacterium]